jgi:hypothetical protein
MRSIKCWEKMTSPKIPWVPGFRSSIPINGPIWLDDGRTSGRWNPSTRIAQSSSLRLGQLLTAPGPEEDDTRVWIELDLRKAVAHLCYPPRGFAPRLD